MATRPGFWSWLKLTKEQDNSGNGTYGVYSAKVSPVENTDFCWIRLDQNNAFTPRPMPAMYTIRSADASNRRVQTGSARTAVAGTLNTLLYPDRAQFFLDAAGLLAGSPPELTSYSAEYFDTQKTFRLLGGKVDKLRLSCDAQGQLVRLNYDWIFQQSAASPPALSAPAITNFSAGNPYTHQESSTVVKLKNTALASYKSLFLAVDNKLVPTFDELAYIDALYWCGRDVDWGVNIGYASTQYRTDLETVAVQTTNQLKWVKGGNSVTFDLKSTNFLTGVADDAPLDGPAYQNLGVAVYHDRSAAVDMGYTVV